MTSSLKPFFNSLLYKTNRFQTAPRVPLFLFLPHFDCDLLNICITYFEVDCNKRRAHEKFHVSAPFSLLADNGRKLIVTMTILNVTEKYELRWGSYRCIAYAGNSSKTAQIAFHIYVIRGMFFNKQLDKVIFKFK